MATDLTALQKAIKLVADAVNDGIKAAGDSGVPAKIGEFTNLLPDLMAVLPSIGDIPTEVNALSPADYATLLASVAADLTLPNAKVAGVVNASVKVLSDLATVLLPDVKVLIAAIKA